tara:strand:+ start:101 stop:562 length:462 start_codon:yes stop_codon:yes gene_type:complete
VVLNEAKKTTCFAGDMPTMMNVMLYGPTVARTLLLPVVGVQLRPDFRVIGFWGAVEPFFRLAAVFALQVLGTGRLYAWLMLKSPQCQAFMNIKACLTLKLAIALATVDLGALFSLHLFVGAAETLTGITKLWFTGGHLELGVPIGVAQDMPDI